MGTGTPPLVCDPGGWHRVGSDETLTDCPSQRGLIEGAWSRVFLVKLYDAPTNIASSVDELGVVRGPTAACSSSCHGLKQMFLTGKPVLRSLGALPSVLLHSCSALSVQPADG